MAGCGRLQLAASLRRWVREGNGSDSRGMSGWHGVSRRNEGGGEKRGGAVVFRRAFVCFGRVVVQGPLALTNLVLVCPALNVRDER